MTKYIQILLLENGAFCKAPLCSVYDGDYVTVKDMYGNNNLLKVIATVTDAEDGEFVNMMEKYINYPLPKVNNKYHAIPIEWEGEENAE